MKATVVILLAILLVGSLLVIAAEVQASQPPVYHSPNQAQNGKLTFFEPRHQVLSYDFFKHYADSNTDFRAILNPGCTQEYSDSWESVKYWPKIIWGNGERREAITYIMLNSATRFSGSQRLFGISCGYLSKSQFGTRV